MFGLHQSKLGKLTMQKAIIFNKICDRSQEFYLHSAHRPMLLIFIKDFISRTLQLSFQNNTPKATKRNPNCGAVNNAACVFTWVAASSLSR